MRSTRHHEPTRRKPLRLRPGIILAVFTALVAYAVPRIAPGTEIFSLPLGMLSVLAGTAGAVGIAVWWLFFSRAPWPDRLGVLVLMIVAVAATRLFVHQSMARAGMGMLFYFMTIPVLGLALVAAAVVGRNLADGWRRSVLAAAVLLACTPWTLIRTAGVIGGGGAEFHWRWTPTPEERLLAQADEPLVASVPDSPVEPTTRPEGIGSTRATPAAPGPTPPRPGAIDTGAPTPGRATEGLDAGTSAVARAPVPERISWPGFRGPHRDSVIHGVRIATDWSASPPTLMWRRPIGPGWSSFAVQGDHLYTQEQRGEDEIVACYRVSTGEPVWRHRDAVRFWESEGGAGPRATPTLHDGRVYAFGATGILNALDAATGRRLWSRNVASDTGRRIPDWGFASSPLIVDDLVVVAASGTLAAYGLESGEPRWRGPSYGGSYSSPHLATLDGVRQIVQLGGPGAFSVSPADGVVLWEHTWEPGAIVQPAMTSDGDIVVNTLGAAGGLGTRRLSASHGSDGWHLEERWTSIGLKPYFNDFVIHKGHAFGFDGSILASINLADGTRNWKGGRYGNGQMILLSDQDVLLVISEDGELALVSATTDQYRELARFPALNAKTWNHPVLVDDVLLIRNGEEMAAFRMPITGR